MLRVASGLAIALGMLILAAFVPVLVDMVLLGQKFGATVTATMLAVNPHVLAITALGFALVVGGAWGFTRGRREG